MKRLALSLVLILGFSCGGLQAAGINWYTDYNKAETAAKQENKPLLLFFTGSDWCGWCKKLDKEVFKQAEFAKLAGNKYIFVELDFPNRGNQSEAIKAQNKRLCAQYRVEGYPTVILLSPAGKKLGQTGYREGGPKAYAAHLQQLAR